MAKVLIAYTSKTGNTKKFAYKIYDHFKDKINIDITSIEESSTINLDDYDTVMVGCWIHRATYITTGKRFLRKLKNKKLVLFGTMASNPTSPHGKRTYEKIKNLPKDSNEVLEVVLLNGKAAPEMVEQIKKIPSLFVSKEKKELMIASVLTSRQATEEEYNNAILQIEKSLHIEKRYND